MIHSHWQTLTQLSRSYKCPDPTMPRFSQIFKKTKYPMLRCSSLSWELCVILNVLMECRVHPEVIFFLDQSPWDLSVMSFKQGCFCDQISHQLQTHTFRGYMIWQCGDWTGFSEANTFQNPLYVYFHLFINFVWVMEWEITEKKLASQF